VQASDVYSLGVVMHEMLTARQAWGCCSHSQICYAVLDAGETLTIEDPCALGTLALRCMHADPSQRPTAASVLASLQ